VCENKRETSFTSVNFVDMCGETVIRAKLILRVSRLSLELFILIFFLFFFPFPPLLLFQDILDKCLAKRVHRLIIVDSTKRVEGIVSLSDILRFFLGYYFFPPPPPPPPLCFFRIASHECYEICLS
jgi:hypothetical protein